MARDCPLHSSGMYKPSAKGVGEGVEVETGVELADGVALGSGVGVTGLKASVTKLHDRLKHTKSDRLTKPKMTG